MGREEARLRLGVLVDADYGGGVIARCRAAEQQLLKSGIETDTADQMHDRGVRFHESIVEGSGNAFFIDTSGASTACDGCFRTGR